jgi:metal-responsive CopG/Arc/MetJ family transcriptional regulator
MLKRISYKASLQTSQTERAMKAETIRTTLTIPKELLEATDKAVLEGKAKSRNDFVVQALKRELAAQKRAEIDAALAEMAKDPDYQAEVLKMEAEFAPAQWEALQLGESPR